MGQLFLAVNLWIFDRWFHLIGSKQNYQSDNKKTDQADHDENSNPFYRVWCLQIIC